MTCARRRRGWAGRSSWPRRRRPGNDATARLLAEVVDVDPATGTARLRAEASKAARMTLDSRSTVTVRVRGGAERVEAECRLCPAGHESATADYATTAAHRLCACQPAPAPPRPPPAAAALPGLRGGAGGPRPVLRGLRARLHQAAAVRPPRGRWSPPRTGPGSRRCAAAKAPTSRRWTFPQLLPAAHVPAARRADGDRAPQPLPRRRPRDRPLRAAARPGRLHAARGAAGRRRTAAGTSWTSARRNGTVVNGHPDPIAPHAPVRLAAADRITTRRLDGAHRAGRRSVAVAGGRGLRARGPARRRASARRSRRGCRPCEPVRARR